MVKILAGLVAICFLVSGTNLVLAAKDHTKKAYKATKLGTNKAYNKTKERTEKISDKIKEGTEKIAR